MNEFIGAFFNLEIIVQSLPILWKGTVQTILLSLMVVPLGVASGLILSVLTTSGIRTVRVVASLWTDIFRSIPPLVLLVMVYGGLPFLGYEIGAWGAIGLTFFLVTGAYYGEVLRAGVESVPKGQMEAARSTGLSAYQAAVWVVYPQGIRNVIPDLINNTVEVIKYTSLASVVSVPELLFQANQVQNLTYNASPITAAALIYVLLLWPLVRLVSRLENKPTPIS